MDIANRNKSVDLSTGHWIDDIPNHPDLRMKVRASTYKPYRVAAAALARRSNKQLRSDEGVVDFSVATGKPMAEHLLIDWDGVKNGGKPVKYDPKLALELLTSDDAFDIGGEFRAAVLYAAERVTEKLAQATEEAAGN
jgi:hypothetical protein